MDDAATAYMKNCYEFLKGQEEGLAKEIEAGAEAAKLKERYQKIQWMNDVVDLGNGIRARQLQGAGPARAGPAEGGREDFEDITRKLDGLKAITRLDVNLKQLEAVRAAAKSYKDATCNLLVNWDALEGLGQDAAAAAGNAVIAQAQATADAGIEGTDDIAESALAVLSFASTLMVSGLVVATIVGIVLAIFITRSITGPIRRIIDGMSEGA